MSLAYSFSQAGRTVIAVSTLAVTHLSPNCDPPNTCIKSTYEASGPQTFAWAGVDASGAYLPGIQRLAVIKLRSDFPRNGVVVFGTRPTVTNVRVSPPVFGPAVGTQEVSFDLSTYQGGTVDVELTFLNQESRSVLRKVLLEDQPPGHVVWTWNGRADNGMLVAPGPYTVTVSIVDALGNEAQGQILTWIQY